MKKDFYTFLLILASIYIAFFTYKVLYDEEVPFLRAHSKAEWILCPHELPKDRVIIQPGNLWSVFRKRFYIEEMPDRAVLYIKAFREFGVKVNGEFIPTDSSKANWKKKRVIIISDYLKRGENLLEIAALNDRGPPILWAYTDGLKEEVSSDETWQVNFQGSDYKKAVIADKVPLPKVSKEGPVPIEALIKKLPNIAISFIVFFLLYLAIKRKNLLGKVTPSVFKLMVSIPFIMLLILFANNFLKVKLDRGFDLLFHIDYIMYIVKNKALPTPIEGWSMYNPPLYYALSAFLFRFSTIFFSKEFAFQSLKLIPIFCGLGQVYLVYVASKSLFPDSRKKKLLSVVISSLIPMNIYISHYLSNESLCAFLISLSIVVAVKIVKSERVSILSYLVLGLILGLSLLTRFTGVIALTIICLTLSIKALKDKRYDFLSLARVFFGIFLMAILISGWVYYKNIRYCGAIFGNIWDADPTSGLPWWQYPGYHTFRYFMRFGRVFLHPYFASHHSFFDSLYSTFWGDGLLAGATSFGKAAPWNYEYMSIVYLVSIPFALLFLVGLWRAAKVVLADLDEAWFLMLTFSFAMASALLYMCLKLPYYAQAKSFYMLSAILPFSLISAWGAQTIDRFFERNKLAVCQGILYAWLGVLILTVFVAFLVLGPCYDKAWIGHFIDFINTR